MNKIERKDFLNNEIQKLLNLADSIGECGAASVLCALLSTRVILEEDDDFILADFIVKGFLPTYQVFIEERMKANVVAKDLLDKIKDKNP